MKFFYLVLSLIAFIVAGCQQKKKDATTVQESETIVITEQEPVDMHTAKNSLDFQGVYKGVLPTASGSGMEIEITLSDSTYQKSVLYIEQGGNPIITKGRFMWDDSGTIITLEGEEAPNKYFVGEDRLFHLDMEGNKITGDLAEQYILNKQGF